MCSAIGEPKEMCFNTEAFAKGAFVGIDIHKVNEQALSQALAAVIEAKRAEEQRQAKAAIDRKRELAHEALRSEEQEQAAYLASLAREEEASRKREQETIAAAKVDARRTSDWLQCVKARDITRVTHFTRLQNLSSILKHGLYR